MNKKAYAERLKEIEGRVNAMTAEDKAFLANVAEARGRTLNERCPDCWRDFFYELRSEVVKRDGRRAYIFKGSRPLFWRGHRIDGNTPPKVVREFIAAHPNNRNFFELIKKKNDEEKHN